MSDRFVVVGLRRSGLAAADAIRRMRPDAVIRGTDPGAGVDVARLEAAGVEYLPGDADVPIDDATALVKSPGVPGEAAIVERARAAGVPVWSEVELAYRLLDEPRIVGVTGTNGKSTTTELIGAMLREGLDGPVEVAGNIGRALTELPGRVAADAWIVCELSSFQLEDIDTFRARVGVVLNVTPDHLDRHGTMERYLACKLRLFENQTAEDTAVLNGDDPLLASAELPGRGRRVLFHRRQSDRVDWEHSGIRGQHNLENALAAAAAAEAVGVDRAARDRALRAFRAPPHRLEEVAVRADGVRFVNDSKATNPEAAVMALTAFKGGVHLILGGSLKGGSFAALAAAVARGPVVATYLIGQAAGEIAAALDAAGVTYHRAGDLETAVAQAAGAARPGETVLLSPACASFDQFRDFEHRGERFRELAREVAGG
ncbi:MAG TPA: UDP-N-acetylmuramoyl-L-alanine--D-glutamate ligase [Gaiellales bacterium]|nr:UDP-N-acetylmuramoyl-L-alanine--D-glutamate ligase [Gaiellales bacterium]